MSSSFLAAGESGVGWSEVKWVERDDDSLILKLQYSRIVARREVSGLEIVSKFGNETCDLNILLQDRMNCRVGRKAPSPETIPRVLVGKKGKHRQPRDLISDCRHAHATVSQGIIPFPLARTLIFITRSTSVSICCGWREGGGSSNEMR